MCLNPMLHGISVFPKHSVERAASIRSMRCDGETLSNIGFADRSVPLYFCTPIIMSVPLPVIAAIGVSVMVVFGFHIFKLLEKNNDRISKQITKANEQLRDIHRELKSLRSITTRKD